MESTTRPVDTVRLTAAALETILGVLDAFAAETPSNRRQTERIPYRVRSCICSVIHPGTNSYIPYASPTRNISAGGVGIFHGSYLHPHSKCVVQLISRRGEWNKVRGAVVRCRHVRGRIHEAGIAFEKPVDVADYIVEQRRGRILLVEDDRMMGLLVKKLLNELEMDVDHVESGEEALTLASRARYDGVVMDIQLPGMDGVAATMALRAATYAGLIVAATASEEPEVRGRCLAAGCDWFLPKPYALAELLAFVQALRATPAGCAGAAEDPGARAFLAGLSGRLDAVAVALAGKDDSNLVGMLHEIVDQAVDRRFDEIVQSALVMEEAVISGIPPGKLRSCLLNLATMCLSAIRAVPAARSERPRAEV